MILQNLGNHLWEQYDIQKIHRNVEFWSFPKYIYIYIYIICIYYQNIITRMGYRLYQVRKYTLGLEIMASSIHSVAIISKPLDLRGKIHRKWNMFTFVYNSG
jgi:hypothetical protein